MWCQKESSSKSLVKALIAPQLIKCASYFCLLFLGGFKPVIVNIASFLVVGLFIPCGTWKVLNMFLQYNGVICYSTLYSCVLIKFKVQTMWSNVSFLLLSLLPLISYFFVFPFYFLFFIFFGFTSSLFKMLIEFCLAKIYILKYVFKILSDLSHLYLKCIWLTF